MKIRLQDWPAHVRHLGDRMMGAAHRGIISGAARCVPIMQRRTEQAVPASDSGRPGAFNTGNYRMRWRSRTLPNGAAVFNDASYAGIIDRGRRRGTMPPLRAIEAWARRRLGLSQGEAKRAAYPIAMAIKRRGLRPRRVMSGAREDLHRVVREEIRRELDAELHRR